MSLPQPRLFVLDDELPILRVVRRLFVRDFTIVVESDPVAGLRLVRATCFDVLLCDVNLTAGQMSGRDFFESLSSDVQARTVMWSGVVPDRGDAFAASLGKRFVSKAGALGDLLPLLRGIASLRPCEAA